MKVFYFLACDISMFQDGDKEFSKDVLDERAKKAEAWHCDSAVCG